MNPTANCDGNIAIPGVHHAILSWEVYFCNSQPSYTNCRHARRTRVIDLGK